MTFFDHDFLEDFSSMERSRATSLFKVAMLCFLLILAPNCVKQRIVGNQFVHDNKGYAFLLPEVDWEIDEEAWRYERDFGYIIVSKKPKTRSVRKSRTPSGTQPDDLNIRLVPAKKIKKLLLDMDSGFRHKTRASEILVGTIIEGSLIKFIKGNFPKNDVDLPQNLIAGYMKRLQGFYSPLDAKPAAVTVRTLAQSRRAYRMEWVEGQDLRVLYGISLYKEFLFISLQVNLKSSAEEIEEGLKTLDQLVESVVITAGT
jgi:hypothetical protein